MAAFATRAPLTLRKHSGAMNMYTRCCQVSGYDPFPILEQKTWNYCSFLKESCAPATRADSFIKAARVTIQLLSMKASPWHTAPIASQEAYYKVPTPSENWSKHRP